jgi:hypothetical protein
MISGGGLENRSPKKSVSAPRRRRHLSATEREEQDRIDRENRILVKSAFFNRKKVSIFIFFVSKFR